MYKIKLIGNKATSGDPVVIKAERGKTVTLPKNPFKRDGFVFVGWSTKRNNKINMKHFQLGDPKYKNKDEVKNLGKDGETVKLYACWKGVGPEAAATWAKMIAKDNSFNYGYAKDKHWYHNRSRAGQIGCYFCGTNITGVKKAKKGSRWEKTYCCNSFAMASYVHGMGLFSECRGGSTEAAYWTRLKRNGKQLFKIVGTKLKYKDLKPGDILCNGKHVKIFTGKSIFKGLRLVTHAAGEGWGKKSIRTDRVSMNARTGNYTVVRFIKGEDNEDHD